MATPKELVKAVADVLGVPAATVNVHDRNLLQAGLRTSAGRGRALVHVTPSDVANLLIAVAASQNVKDSVKTVNQHDEMFSRGRWTGKALSVPELLSLPDKHTFPQALAAIIEAATTGSLERALTEKYGKQVPLLEILSVRFTLTRQPSFFAGIHIATEDELTLEWEDEESLLYFPEPFKGRPKGKLGHEVSFDVLTIMKIGDLLRQ